MKWHERNSGFKCRICYFEFGDKESLITHRKLHETKPQLECLICEKLFKTIRLLRTHVEIHVRFD